MVYSHNHWDHIAGGKVLKDQGAKFISHENCVAAFRRIPSPSVVMPDITFSKAHALKLGGTTIELRYHGRNHGNCLISMRLPREKVLFVVDIVAPKSVGFRDLPNFTLVIGSAPSRNSRRSTLTASSRVMARRRPRDRRCENSGNTLKTSRRLCAKR